MSQSMMGMCCRCLSEDVGRVPDALGVKRLEAPHLVIQPRFVRNFTLEEVHQRDDEPVHDEQVLSVP